MLRIFFFPNLVFNFAHAEAFTLELVGTGWRIIEVSLISLENYAELGLRSKIFPHIVTEWLDINLID